MKEKKSINTPDKELFKNEIEILETALYQINDEKFSDNALLAKFAQLASDYQELLRLTTKVFKISDTQGKELKKKSNELKDILDNSNQGLFTFGRELIVNREYSAECLRIFNRKIAGCHIEQLLSDNNRELNIQFKTTFENVFNTGEPEQRASYLQSLPAIITIGENILHIKYKMITQEDIKYDSILVVLTDITEKRKTEDQVAYLTYHDKLTSLYNRAYIESMLPQLQSESKMPLSVMTADMNGLKLTNDIFGHEYGDKLLINAGKILTNCLRKNDLVARWGGDEFLMILPNTGSNDCKRVCKRIKDQCSKLDFSPIMISISLGYATQESPTTGISELLNIAENRMYSNKMIESKMVRKEILKNIDHIVINKFFEDPGHVDRLQEAVTNFKKILKLNSESADIKVLLRLASLHDIGKIAIPREILSKPDTLTGNEWEIVKSYTEIGYRIAQSIDEPYLAQGLLALRERWDGTGYPYGIKENDIPYSSRIISIVEAFDVMTHDRPYKSSMSREEAIEEIKRCSGSQFDPYLAETFLAYLDKIVPKYTP